MSVERVALRPGYEVARIVKGGWQLSGGHGAFDRDEAIADMRRFLEAGIDAFDCADIYTGVEEMIGEFIGALPAAEADRVRVHTKLVPDLGLLPAFTPADAEAIIDRSLKRLRIERLHLVQMFWWDLAQGRPFEVMASLKDLQAKGKIAHLAVTNFDTDAIGPLVEAGVDVVSAQVQYSLLDSRPEGRFAAWCAARNIGLICYGVLAGGFLTEAWLGQPDPGHQFENRSLIKYRLIIDEFGGWDLFQSLLETLHRIAQRHGVTIGAVAARAMLDRPGVAGVILGARSARRLAETLAVFDLALDDADRAALDRVLVQRKGPEGPVFALEGDRTGRHGRIMKYNLNTAT
jgi:aryl-alcohol dehydrogenase-like predicted oxidoreductase